MGLGLTVKTLPIRNIITQQNPHGSSIIRCSDSPEPLLTRRIPYLQLDSLSVQIDGSDLEIDPDGGDEGGRKGVFGESQETAGFAHTGVADQEEFDL